MPDLVKKKDDQISHEKKKKIDIFRNISESWDTDVPNLVITLSCMNVPTA